MLTRLRLENFKSWRDTGEVPLRPITGFFGPNSSGKSSIFQALLLMKQTAESADRGVLFHFGDGNTPVDLGDFESTVYRHDSDRLLKFSIGWRSGRNVVAPDIYAGASVNEGDDLRFDVEVGMRERESEHATFLESMTYGIGGRWEFGMRRTSAEGDYQLFAHGPGADHVFASDKVARYAPPNSFHRFPFWAHDVLADREFLFTLQYALTLALEDISYLGPLRAHPQRIYHRSGAQPRDIGATGEFVMDALLHSQGRDASIRQHLGHRPVEADVVEWLRRLELVDDFRIENLAAGSRWFEVKVRKSAGSAEVLLTDVGFGVSQILPVLALCFYVPEGSTIVLEQPDIHLHPSVQAGLADVLIDAWKKRKVQILVESHSEHLLRRLQRRIAEEGIERSDVGLLFCSMDENGTSHLSQLEVDPFGNIANWPEDFFGDQFGEMAAMSEAALARRGDVE